MSDFLKPIMPVPLLVGTADCKPLCDEMAGLAYALRDALPEGRLVSEAWDIGKRSADKQDFLTNGVTSFNSTEDLFNKPEWQTAAQFLYDFAKTMIESVDTSGRRFHFINMWTTIYPTGCFVPEHVHSNAMLSGVFYVKAPKGCGDIVFHDPAWVAKTMFVGNDVQAFPSVATKWSEEAQEGKMVLFPSWLPHRSLPNESTEDRIIVSFNIGFNK